MQTKKLLSLILTVLVSVILVAGTALAVSTVGTNITTGGDLTITGSAAVGVNLGVTGVVTVTGDLAVNGGDVTTTATTWNFDVANTGTVRFRDSAANVLLTITDMGTNGKLTIGGRAIIGGAGTNNVFVTGGNDTTTGQRNVALGGAALTAVTTGSDLVAIGYEALNGTTTGNDKIAIGHDAGMTGPGDFTVLIGQDAGKMTTGGRSVYIGSGAADNITTGGYNVAIGVNALSGSSATTAEYTTAVGYAAGVSLTTGTENVLFGDNSGSSLTTGNQNVIIGSTAGSSTSTGNQNVIIGAYSFGNAGTYSGSVAIGYGTRLTASNTLVIDNSNTTSPLIYGDFATNVLTVNGALGVVGNISPTNGALVYADIGTVTACAVGAATLDLATGNFFTLDMTAAADCAITFSNGTIGGIYVVQLEWAGANAFTLADTTYQNVTIAALCGAGPNEDTDKATMTILARAADKAQILSCVQNYETP